MRSLRHGRRGEVVGAELTEATAQAVSPTTSTSPTLRLRLPAAGQFGDGVQDVSYVLGYGQGGDGVRGNALVHLAAAAGGRGGGDGVGYGMAGEGEAELFDVWPLAGPIGAGPECGFDELVEGSAE